MIVAGVETIGGIEVPAYTMGATPMPPHPGQHPGCARGGVSGLYYTVPWLLKGCLVFTSVPIEYTTVRVSATPGVRQRRCVRAYITQSRGYLRDV